MATSRAVLLAIVLLGAAVACGDGGGGSSGTEAGGSEEGGSGEAAFPVTIEHQFGETTVEEEPERVVSLGLQEHDTIFALGVEPVAVRYWYGPEDDVIHPWAEEAAGDADPEILVMPELNVEAVAALEPDLILGIYSGITEEEYDLLSGLAPTVAQTGEHVEYGTPWQETVRTTGRALGLSDRAEELVAGLEARFAEEREAHPEWEGREVAIATYGPDTVGFFASDDPRARFFRALGFEVPDELNEIAGDAFYGEISFEEVGALDHDLLVWDQLAYTPGGRATVEGDRLVQRLAATTEGRTVFLEGLAEDAFAWNTVLSQPTALDALVPMIEEALG
jgi:iron complex transport system substrate-binding protein